MQGDMLTSDSYLKKCKLPLPNSGSLTGLLIFKDGILRNAVHGKLKSKIISLITEAMWCKDESKMLAVDRCSSILIV